MHGADWLPTLSSVAGYDLDGTLPLDGVNQWAALKATAKGEFEVARHLGRGQKKHSMVVIGNSTNACSWPIDDPRYHFSDELLEGARRGADVPSGAALASLYGYEAAASLGCGFAIHQEINGSRWKLIKGYGGGPDTYCNTSSLPGGNKCGVPEDPTPMIPYNTIKQTTPTKCDVMNGQCFEGQDFHSFEAYDAAGCCTACNFYPRCIGYTFNSALHKCYLKTEVGEPIPGQNCTSGTNGRPEICRNGWCLFDVGKDPYELHEVSHDPANSAVFNHLKAEMRKVLQSYTEYEIDPICGNVTFANDPIVGKTWQPWC